MPWYGAFRPYRGSFVMSSLRTTYVPLNVGSNTAVLRGKNNTTGIALVEAYNLE